MNKRSVMVSAILATIAVVTPTATAEPANLDGLVAAYHLTTKDGWSNDLQSIVWNEKAKHYDLYFLHSADGTENPLGQGERLPVMGCPFELLHQHLLHPLPIQKPRFMWTLRGTMPA